MLYARLAFGSFSVWPCSMSMPDVLAGIAGLSLHQDRQPARTCSRACADYHPYRAVGCTFRAAPAALFFAAAVLPTAASACAKARTAAALDCAIFSSAAPFER